MKGFHKFLKDRRAKNEPMPESRDDLMEIYKVERPSFLMPRQNNSRRPSSKIMWQAKY